MTIQKEVTEQYFPVILFIMLCKGVTFSDNKRWINFVAKNKTANAIYRKRFPAYGTFVLYGYFLKNLTDLLSFFLCLERGVTFSDNKRWINFVAKNKNANAIYRTRSPAYGTFVLYGYFLKN